MHIKSLLLAVVFGAAISISAPSVKAGELNGTWRTEGGWLVKIYRCGGSYCGKVVGGAKGKDIKNPDPAKRSRRLVGIRLFSGMKKAGKGYAGRLYNPKDGKTYSGKVKVLSARAIKLSGCVLGGLICKGQKWAKVR